jgi:hypothetical protein
MTEITFYTENRKNPYLEDFISRMEDLRYRYYASELFSRLSRLPDFNADQAIRKSMVICKLAGLPVQHHFVAVYRSELSGIRRDWKLSELACGFAILSFTASTGEAREIQDAFIRYIGL